MFVKCLDDFVIANFAPFWDLYGFLLKFPGCIIMCFSQLDEICSFVQSQPWSLSTLRLKKSTKSVILQSGGRAGHGAGAAARARSSRPGLTTLRRDFQNVEYRRFNVGKLLAAHNFFQESWNREKFSLRYVRIGVEFENDNRGAFTSKNRCW